jgi:hypothetical protein
MQVGIGGSTLVDKVFSASLTPSFRTTSPKEKAYVRTATLFPGNRAIPGQGVLPAGVGKQDQEYLLRTFGGFGSFGLFCLAIRMT